MFRRKDTTQKMENNEAKFAKILEEVRYTGRMQGGYISKEDVKKAFEEMELDDQQFEMVFEYLKANQIGLDEPINESEYLSSNEIDILSQYKEELETCESIGEGKKEALVMAAMNNDSGSYPELINFYLPKVLEIAKLYVNQGVFLEDLIGEGNLAVAEGVTMLGALEKPSEADGMIIKLIMDAMESIIGENFKEQSEDKKLAEKVNSVSDKARELSEELGRKVTVEELAENSGLSKKAIRNALAACGNNIDYIENTES